MAKCLIAQGFVMRASWVRRCLDNGRVEALFSFQGKYDNPVYGSGSHFCGLEGGS